MTAAQREHALLHKMQVHGSNFTRALATAWLAADPNNRAKLREAFGQTLERYAAAPDPVDVPRAFNGGDQT